jgi:hypothetical protein
MARQQQMTNFSLFMGSPPSCKQNTQTGIRWMASRFEPNLPQLKGSGKRVAPATR